MNTDNKNLAEAIKENVELIIRTNELIEMKKASQDTFAVEQYQHQKTKLLQDLQVLYKELAIEASFMAA